MSFGVNVTYRVKPGRGQEFLDELSAAGIRDIVLKEEGCIRYDFYLPVEKRDEVLLVECWEKQEDQQRQTKLFHVSFSPFAGFFDRSRRACRRRGILRTGYIRRPPDA